MFGKDFILVENLAQEYIWVAEYEDGTADAEFAKEDHYDFYKIRRKDLKRFGLLGREKKFYFDSEGGAFYLDGKKVEIRYREKDVIYNLSGNSERKQDIITYKRASSTAKIAPSGTFSPNIVSYHLGYKDEVHGDENTNLFFKPIVTVLRNNGGYYIEATLTCDRDLNGCLEFLVDGEVVDSYEAPLEQGMKGTINWSL